ncbi:DUF805 domain-containing protein, partial [Pseudomonas aeruginosa]|uniref:DUF805 domain-containing protein n=1 Tax=Pseudomonas aeruginosa TaxID=287 RepID=UPI00287F7701
VNPRPRRVSFLWYSMGWASSGAISTASLIFQIRAKTATALHWWMLIALIPIVGLYLIYLLAKDSDAGQNQYGQNPKGIA